MRIGLVRIMQWSNTFARHPGRLLPESGARWSTDEQLLECYVSTATGLGGALATCQQSGLTPVPLLAVEGGAGGVVARIDLQKTLNAVEKAVRASLPLDGVFVELSGAMVTKEGTNGDLEVLAALRSWLGSDLPIAVLLNHAANISPELPSLVDLALSTRAPATDAAERGAQLIIALSEIWRTRRRPSLAVRRVPLLLPLAWQWTEQEPMAGLLQSIRAEEAPTRGMFGSLTFGFPSADVPWAGAAVFVSDPRGPVAAHERAASLADSLWHARKALQQTTWNVEEAVHTAMANPETAFCLADLGDAPEGGGPGEGTAVLWAMIDLGVSDGLLVTLVDPEALAQAQIAGVGGAFVGALGGKYDTRGGYPIDVEGTVVALTDGRFHRQGAIETGLEEDAGGAALLDVAARHSGHFRVVLTGQPIPPDPGLLATLGVGVTPQLLVVKSALAFRAIWSDRTPLPTETPGITTSDFAFFRFTQLPRPVWPLDPL